MIKSRCLHHVLCWCLVLIRDCNFAQLSHLVPEFLHSPWLCTVQPCCAVAVIYVLFLIPHFFITARGGLFLNLILPSLYLISPEVPRGDWDHWRVPTVLQPWCCSWSCPGSEPAPPSWVTCPDTSLGLWFLFITSSPSFPTLFCSLLSTSYLLNWNGGLGEFWGLALLGFAASGVQHSDLWSLCRSARERGWSKEKLQNCWTPQSRADPPCFPSLAVLSRRITTTLPRSLTTGALKCFSGIAFLFIMSSLWRGLVKFILLHECLHELKQKEKDQRAEFQVSPGRVNQR